MSYHYLSFRTENTLKNSLIISENTYHTFALLGTFLRKKNNFHLLKNEYITLRAILFVKAININNS